MNNIFLGVVNYRKTIAGDKMKINKFFCVVLHKDELKVSFSMLFNDSGVLPIIWMNNGLYGLLTREKVKNTLQYLENNKKLQPTNIYPSWTFYWDEVLLMPPAVGEQLFGKQSNQ